MACDDCGVLQRALGQMVASDVDAWTWVRAELASKKAMTPSVRHGMVRRIDDLITTLRTLHAAVTPK